MNLSLVNNERELLLRLRNGDTLAFEQLYDSYKVRLTVNLLRMLKSPELVEDVLQDLFMEIWINRKNIDPERSIKAYLFQIAANKTKNIFRRAATEQKLRRFLLPIWVETYGHIEENIIEEENKHILHKLLDHLSPQQRSVYTLCKIEGYSYKEVSEQLRISETTVNTHIRNANLVLKELLHKHPELIWKAISLALLINI